MLLRHVGLVSESQSISFSELGRVSAALQKQAIRDLGPVWNVQATVDVFGRLEDLPVGTWPILIQDDINTPGAAGVHEDEDGQPFALVTAGNGWSLTASHELVEMLVDPFGRRLAEGVAEARSGARPVPHRALRPERGRAVRIPHQRRDGLGLLHAQVLLHQLQPGRPLQPHGRDRSRGRS